RQSSSANVPAATARAPCGCSGPLGLAVAWIQVREDCLGCALHTSPSLVLIGASSRARRPSRGSPTRRTASDVHRTPQYRQSTRAPNSCPRVGSEALLSCPITALGTLADIIWRTRPRRKACRLKVGHVHWSSPQT